MGKDTENPHGIIQFIDQPKKWREKASIILIKLHEDGKQTRLQQKGIIVLLMFVLTLLAKLVFVP